MNWYYEKWNENINKTNLYLKFFLHSQAHFLDLPWSIWKSFKNVEFSTCNTQHIVLFRISEHRLSKVPCSNPSATIKDPASITHWLGTFHFWLPILVKFEKNSEFYPINVKCLLQALHIDWALFIFEYLYWWNLNFTQSMWNACCKHYTLIGHFSKFLCLDHTSTSLLKTTQSMWNACAIYVRKHFTLIG